MHLEWIDEQDAFGQFKRTRLECNHRMVASITRTFLTPIVKSSLRWFVESTSGLLKCNGEASTLDMVPMLQAMIEQMVTTEYQYSHADSDEAPVSNDTTSHAHQG